MVVSGLSALVWFFDAPVAVVTCVVVVVVATLSLLPVVVDAPSDRSEPTEALLVVVSAGLEVDMEVFMLTSD